MIPRVRDQANYFRGGQPEYLEYTSFQYVSSKTTPTEGQILQVLGGVEPSNTAAYSSYTAPAVPGTVGNPEILRVYCKCSKYIYIPVYTNNRRSTASTHSKYEPCTYTGSRESVPSQEYRTETYIKYVRTYVLRRYRK